MKLLFSFQSARKKRNRKKQAKTNDPETSDVAVIKENNEKVSQLNQNSLEGIVHVMEIKEIFRLCKGNKKPSKIILHLKKLFGIIQVLYLRVRLHNITWSVWFWYPCREITLG